jgi:hypothetical protein
MKSRVGLCALGLLMLVGTMGCGGEADPPDVPGDTVKQAGAPTGVTVTAGDGQVTVSWTPPADNGGGTITGYTVQVLTNGAVQKSVKSTAAATTVKELTNGTAYTFAVAAINSLGDGHFSAQSSAVTPHTVPGAPRDILATPGNQQVALSWTAPVDAGMPITGYSVTVMQGETQVKSQQATGLSATITDLANGTAYSFTVTATNAVVAGPVSAPVIATPRTIPGAPRVTAAPVVDHSQEVRVAWSLDDDGGSPVTRYTVTVLAGGTQVKTLESTAKELVVLELTNGTAYTFTVVASNEAGNGPPSEPVTATPRDYAGPPRDVSCTESVKAEPAYGECSWTAPLDDGGSPITGYRVTVYTLGTFNEGTAFYTTERNVRVTGLQNGKTYYVWVVARTDAGFGYHTEFRYFAPYTTPSPVTGLSATSNEDGAVTLRWTPPAFNGSNVQAYYLSVEPGGQSFTLPSDDAFTTIRGLTNGTTYTFTLVSENRAGLSEPASVEGTPVAPPK